MPLTKIHKSGAGSVATAHGDFLPIDAHGTYEVPDVLARELVESHGFMPGPGGPAAAAAAAPTSATAIKGQSFPEGSVFPPRNEMMRFLKERRVAVPANIKNEALAQLVREYVFVPPMGGVTDPGESPDRSDGDGLGKGAEKPTTDADDAADEKA